MTFSMTDQDISTSYPGLAEGLKIWRGHLVINGSFSSVSSKLFSWEGTLCPPGHGRAPPALHFTLGLLAKEDDGDTVISLVLNLHLEK